MLKSASAIALLLANVLPAAGVLFWGWEAFYVVFLYWFENLIVGAFNILRMISASPGPRDQVAGGSPTASLIGAHAAKVFMVPFFTVHYGMFCLVHGVFVFALFGRESGTITPPPGHRGGLFSGVFGAIDEVVTPEVLLCLVGLIISHGYSFLANYLGKGEYKTTPLPALMMRPYPRIVVIHIAILFGAFISMSFGSPIGIMLLLIALKTILDLILHEREHRKAQERLAASTV